MCVIIVRPANKTISGAILAQANKANPHGWGIAATTPQGKMQIRRGFDTAQLLTAYNELGAAENTVVVHCRIGTSGKLNTENTHPFKIATGKYLFHNGIFSDIELTTPDRSDTWHLAQQMKPLFRENPNTHHDPEFISHMTRYCTKGYPNKLVIMTQKDVVIINDKAGLYVDGVWFSNSSAFPPSRSIIKPMKTLLQPQRKPVLATVEPARKHRTNRNKSRYERRASQILRLHQEHTDAPEAFGDPDFYNDDEVRARRRAELQEAFDADNAKWEAYLEKKYGKKEEAK
jgi:hypothetical protein